MKPQGLSVVDLLPVKFSGPSMPHRFFVKSVPLAALFVVGISTASLAHPGLLAMIAVGLWASQLGRPAMWTLPVVFPAMMALGAALGTSGVVMPWIEMGILVSMVVLGAAVALQVQAPLALGAVLVAAFAVLHGYVHGAELPGESSARFYGIGFIAATLVLHTIGIGAGLLAQRPLLMRAAGGAIATIGVLLFVAR